MASLPSGTLGTVVEGVCELLPESGKIIKAAGRLAKMEEKGEKRFSDSEKDGSEIICRCVEINKGLNKHKRLLHLCTNARR